MKQIIAGLSLTGLLALSGTTFAATPSATPSGLAVSCISKTVTPTALCQIGHGTDAETDKPIFPHGFYGYYDATPSATPSDVTPASATPSDTSTAITIWEGR